MSVTHEDLVIVHSKSFCRLFPSSHVNWRRHHRASRTCPSVVWLRTDHKRRYCWRRKSVPIEYSLVCILPEQTDASISSEPEKYGLVLSSMLIRWKSVATSHWHNWCRIVRNCFFRRFQTRRCQEFQWLNLIAWSFERRHWSSRWLLSTIERNE